METFEVKTEVVISRLAEKQLKRLPPHIKRALFYWSKIVREYGIAEIRKRPGYHDEPLVGNRFGQRSVRLNRSYRVIYIEQIDSVKILVLEVSNHGY
jgi:proteic killer suppression protein